MIYTLHGDKSLLYEVVETDMMLADLEKHWRLFYNDENGYSYFIDYVRDNSLPIMILTTDTIHSDENA